MPTCLTESGRPGRRLVSGGETGCARLARCCSRCSWLRYRSIEQYRLLAWSLAIVPVRCRYVADWRLPGMYLPPLFLCIKLIVHCAGVVAWSHDGGTRTVNKQCTMSSCQHHQSFVKIAEAEHCDWWLRDACQTKPFFSVQSESNDTEWRLQVRWDKTVSFWRKNILSTASGIEKVLNLCQDAFGKIHNSSRATGVKELCTPLIFDKKQAASAKPVTFTSSAAQKNMLNEFSGRIPSVLNVYYYRWRRFYEMRDSSLLLGFWLQLAIRRYGCNLGSRATITNAIL